MLADLVRLILLILFLPLILIFIGPLLILAVFRGHQPMGPIPLDMSRYGSVGRIGAFILGVVLWGLVWGGLLWLMLNAFIPLTAVTAVPSVAPATVAPSDTPTPSPVPPTPTLVTIVELTSSPLTPTPVGVVDTPSPLPSTPTPIDTAVPVSPTALPTATAQATPTVTPSPLPATPTLQPPTPQPTDLVQSSATQAAARPTISPQATLTLAERRAVVEVVEEGNILLREAITDGSEEKLQQMEAIWQGLALRVARNFAIETHAKYAKPVQVQYEYIKSPTVDPESSQAEVVVTSREKWTYGGPTQTDKEEIFDFIYTLTEKDGRWLISRYTYRNLPSSTTTPAPTLSPTPTPSPAPSREATPAE